MAPSPNQQLRPRLCSPSPLLGAWRRRRWSETLPGRCRGEGRRCTAARPKSQLPSAARRRTRGQERLDSCVTRAVRLQCMMQVDSNLAPATQLRRLVFESSGNPRSEPLPPSKIPF